MTARNKLLIYVIGIAVFWLTGMYNLALSQSKDFPLIISGIAVVNKNLSEYENRLFFRPFETIEVYFPLVNCGDIPLKDLYVRMTHGDYIVDHIRHPGRYIPELDPGQGELLMTRITANAGAKNVELRLFVENTEIGYQALIVLDFGEDYNNDPDVLVLDCNEPFMVLQQISPSRPPLLAMEKESVKEEYFLPNRLIVNKIPEARYRKEMFVYGASTLLAWGAGTYFMASSNRLYNDTYLNARSNASDIRKKIIIQDRVWQTALISSVPLFAMTGVKYVQQNTIRKQFEAEIIHIKQGAMVSLTWTF